MVEIRVLGCYGSQLPGFNTTSFLLNENILIDAGTVASVLSIEEQIRIDHVLITHAHLDHVRDLMLLADNVCIAAQRSSPIRVASTAGIISAIRTHLFNGIIWPDFSTIPTREKPVMNFETLALETTYNLGGVSVTPFSVSHTVETVGYLIGFDGGSVLFAGDTGPTERMWEIARKENNLLALFIETSFHDSMMDMASRSGHLTPAFLDTELKKLGDRAPDIYLFHMKPLYDLNLIRESIDRMHSRNIRLLKDGDTIKLGR